MPFWMLEGISLELRGVTRPGNLRLFRPIYAPGVVSKA